MFGVIFVKIDKVVWTLELATDIQKNNLQTTFWVQGKYTKQNR